MTVTGKGLRHLQPIGAAISLEMEAEVILA
jgi:hypothetical protein